MSAITAYILILLGVAILGLFVKSEFHLEKIKRLRETTNAQSVRIYQLELHEAGTIPLARFENAEDALEEIKLSLGKFFAVGEGGELTVLDSVRMAGLESSLKAWQKITNRNGEETAAKLKSITDVIGEILSDIQRIEVATGLRSPSGNMLDPARPAPAFIPGQLAELSGRLTMLADRLKTIEEAAREPLGGYQAETVVGLRDVLNRAPRGLRAVPLPEFAPIPRVDDMGESLPPTAIPEFAGMVASVDMERAGKMVNAMLETFAKEWDDGHGNGWYNWRDGHPGMIRAFRHAPSPKCRIGRPAWISRNEIRFDADGSAHTFLQWASGSGSEVLAAPGEWIYRYHGQTSFHGMSDLEFRETFVQAPNPYLAIIENANEVAGETEFDDVPPDPAEPVKVDESPEPYVASHRQERDGLEGQAHRLLPSIPDPEWVRSFNDIATGLGEQTVRPGDWLVRIPVPTPSNRPKFRTFIFSDAMFEKYWTPIVDGPADAEPFEATHFGRIGSPPDHCQAYKLDPNKPNPAWVDAFNAAEVESSKGLSSNPVKSGDWLVRIPMEGGGYSCYGYTDKNFGIDWSPIPRI